AVERRTSAGGGCLEDSQVFGGSSFADIADRDVVGRTARKGKGLAIDADGGGDGTDAGGLDGVEDVADGIGRREVDDFAGGPVTELNGGKVDAVAGGAAQISDARVGGDGGSEIGAALHRG